MPKLYLRKSDPSWDTRYGEERRMYLDKWNKNSNLYQTNTDLNGNTYTTLSPDNTYVVVDEYGNTVDNYDIKDILTNPEDNTKYMEWDRSLLPKDAKFNGKTWESERPLTFHEKYLQALHNSDNPIWGNTRVSINNAAWKRRPDIMLGFVDANELATLPLKIYMLGGLYGASPYIAGAMNIAGGAAGISHLAGENGIKKTYNLFNLGDYSNAAKSFGGDVLDLTMALPFLNRVTRGLRQGTRTAAGETVNAAINEYSPKYLSTYDRATGKFHLSTKPQGEPFNFEEFPNFEELLAARNSSLEVIPATRSGVVPLSLEVIPATQSRVVPEITSPASLETLLDNAGFNRLDNTSFYYPRSGFRYTITDNGLDLSDGFSGFSLNNLEAQNYLQSVANGTYYLNEPYRGVGRLFTLNSHMFENSAPVNSDRFNFDFNTGSNYPITATVYDTGNNAIGIRLSGDNNGSILIDNPQSNKEIIDALNTYILNSNPTPLSPELSDFISLYFPRHSPYMPDYGNEQFTSDRGTFRYYPYRGTFDIRASGHPRLVGAPISQLLNTKPIEVPTIITSAKGLPEFSSQSIGSNWGLLLGISPNYSSLIDMGLWNPRPTTQQVEDALGGSFVEHPDGAIFRVLDLHPSYQNEIPYIQFPESSPIVHLDMLPRENGITTTRGKLSRAALLFIAEKLSSLRNNAKGVLILSTPEVNPTLSKFIADIRESPNLSDLDKYNLLKIAIESPELLFKSVGDYGNYSPHSFMYNANLGSKSPSRFFTEPALHSYLRDFNRYGSDLSNPITSILGGNRRGVFTSSDAKNIQEWMKVNTPLLYNLPLSRSIVPFPVTTIKKKGGKLIKRKK